MAQGADNSGLEQGMPGHSVPMQDALEQSVPVVQGVSEPRVLADERPPRPFRPLLLGLGLMLAGFFGTWDKNTALGAALVDVYAQGTLVIVAMVGWVACAAALYAAASRLAPRRLPLAPVMGAASVLTAAFPALATVYVASGSILMGQVTLSTLWPLLVSGLAGGAGLALFFSGWRTSVRSASWVYGGIYLVLSFALCVGVLMFVRTLDLYACAIACTALPVLGAALLHVQVRILDRPARR